MAAIAIDLDGTLLSDEKILTDRARAALDSALNSGIAVIVATSRPARTIRHFIGSELLSNVSVVSMNGASAIGRPPLAGNHLFELPVGVAEDLADRVLMVDGARAFIERDGFRFAAVPAISPQELTIVSGLSTTRWDVVAALGSEIADLPEIIESRPTKVLIAGGADPLTPLIDEIRAAHGDSLSYFPSDNDAFLNVVKPGVSKWSSLTRLIEPAGIHASTVVAFGDDDPDRVMLEGAGLGIAMSNANDYVKRGANLIAPSNNDDGVAQVVEQILAGR